MKTHSQRPRWLFGDWIRRRLLDRAADPALSKELDELVGETLDVP